MENKFNLKIEEEDTRLLIGCFAVDYTSHYYGGEIECDTNESQHNYLTWESAVEGYEHEKQYLVRQGYTLEDDDDNDPENHYLSCKLSTNHEEIYLCCREGCVVIYK